MKRNQLSIWDINFQTCQIVTLQSLYNTTMDRLAQRRSQHKPVTTTVLELHTILNWYRTRMGEPNKPFIITEKL